MCVKPTATASTPGTAPTCIRTCASRFDLSGQPGIVSRIVTCTCAAVDVDGVDHAELDDVAPELGVDDVRERRLERVGSGGLTSAC